MDDFLGFANFVALNRISLRNPDTARLILLCYLQTMPRDLLGVVSHKRIGDMSSGLSVSNLWI
jgi:hypothetical protein